MKSIIFLKNIVIVSGPLVRVYVHVDLRYLNGLRYSSIKLELMFMLNFKKIVNSLELTLFLLKMCKQNVCIDIALRTQYVNINYKSKSP